jgi:hypothetical protein
MKISENCQRQMRSISQTSVLGSAGVPPARVARYPDRNYSLSKVVEVTPLGYVRRGQAGTPALPGPRDSEVERKHLRLTLRQAVECR